MILFQILELLITELQSLNFESCCDSMVMTDLSKDPKLSEGLTDIKDLSFTDIFILQHMKRFPGPIIRINLLNTLNYLLKSEEMSPSSFYNRLKRLKKKGFIIEANDKTRGQSVSITDLGRQALARISMISMAGSIDFHHQTIRLIEKVIQYLPELKIPSERLLIINLEEGLDVSIFREFTQFAKNVYLAATNMIQYQIIEQEFEHEIIISPMESGTIREADGWFDRILIIGIETNDQQQKISPWLKEAYRLSNSSSLIVITSNEILPETEHYMLNFLVDDLKNNQFMRYSEEESMRRQLEQSGFEEVDLRNFKGQLVAWGRTS